VNDYYQRFLRSYSDPVILFNRTGSQFKEYIRDCIFLGISDKDVDRLATLYTDDITQGSPFDTGTLNAATPQFKRLASLQGDVFFQAPRRLFLKHQSSKQNTWFYCWCLFPSRSRCNTGLIYFFLSVTKRFKTQPVLGSVSSLGSFLREWLESN